MKTQKWRPISTAPMGVNDMIDLWACGQRYTDCLWTKPTYGREYCWCTQSEYDCDGPVWTEVPSPTHWMPLPDPPEPHQGRGGGDVG